MPATVATARLVNALCECKMDHGTGCHDSDALKEVQLRGLLTYSDWPAFTWVITEKGLRFIEENTNAEVEA
jgi:hypothetical protein